MSGTGRPKGTVITWTDERKAQLLRLAATHSRAEAASIMGMAEGSLKGQAQRMGGIKFAGRRRAQSQTKRQQAYSPRRPPVDTPKAPNVAAAIASSLARVDPKRPDVGLRRFSWEVA